MKLLLPNLGRLTTRFRSAPTGVPDPWRRTIVAGWAVLVLAAAGYVAAFGRDAPWVDEWMLLPPLVGEKPVLPWLWEAHNEHRFPLPRLIWFGLHQLTGHDFRAGMFVSVVALAAASWALLGASRRIRGRSHPADLFLPALLLNFGHGENLLIGYQIAFTLPVALTAGVLVLMVRPPDELTSRRVALAGWMTVLIALCGGAGVVLAGPLVVWVVISQLRSERGALAPRGTATKGSVGRSLRPVLSMIAVPRGANAPRSLRTLALVPVGITLVYAAFYLLGYRPNPDPATASANWTDRITVAGEVLAGGLGPFGKDVWPGSAVVVGLFAAAGLLLLRARWTDPAEQVRAAGLGFVGVAGLAVAAAVGIGRAGTGPEVGFASRYAVFGVLPLVAAYFALLLYGPARFAAVGRAVGVIVAILVICFAVPPGLTYGDSVRYRQRELYYAVKSGASPDEVAARCVTRVLSPNDTPTNRAALADGLRVLERHHLGCYRPRGK